MKLVLTALLVFIPLFVSAEQPETVVLDASPTPQPESTIVNVLGRGSEPLDVRLEVQKAGVRFPAALARRIVLETIREVTAQLNPGNPPPVHLKISLRLGQDREYLNTLHGAAENTIISMKRWDEVAFSRFMVRAVRCALLTDNELDQLARKALARAHARVSVAELQSKP